MTPSSVVSLLACLLSTCAGNPIKRGVAYNDIDDADLLIRSANIGWMYNWSPEKPALHHDSAQFIPMIWGAKDVGQISGLVQSHDVPYILGFNEPDEPGQASMAPSDAATYYENQLSLSESANVKILSPAVTSSTEVNMGLDWIAQFMANCSDCNIAGLAVHWYGESSTQFKAFVREAAKAAAHHSLPELWITEFALSSDINGIVDPRAAESFLRDVIPFLESHPAVTRYAYFMCADNFLISNGRLNTVGNLYASLASSSDSCAR